MWNLKVSQVQSSTFLFYVNCLGMFVTLVKKKQTIKYSGDSPEWVWLRHQWTLTSNMIFILCCWFRMIWFQNINRYIIESFSFISSFIHFIHSFCFVSAVKSYYIYWYIIFYNLVSCLWSHRDIKKADPLFSGQST